MVRVFLDRGERLEAVKKLRVGAEYTGDASGNVFYIRQVEPLYKIQCIQMYIFLSSTRSKIKIPKSKIKIPSIYLKNIC